MEQLPDELWLLVFGYLHQYDVLYSFDNLNLRFQMIIQSFVLTIDLSDVSYKLFSRFCREILPHHGHQIPNLIIKGEQQLNFFRKDDKLLKPMNNLQCLTLIEQEWSNELLDFYLTHFPSLRNLRLKLSNDREQRLENILSNHLSQLTELCLLTENGSAYYFYDTRTIRDVKLRLPRLKTLTIQNLKTTSDMYYLFEIMCNLEEISLSIENFDQKPLLNDQIPKSLNTMRLELTCMVQKQETAEMLRNFLFLFKKQLESLKLVVNCTDKGVANELHETLKTNLSDLTCFAYSMEILDLPAQLPTTAEDYLAATYSFLDPKITLQQLKHRTTIYLCNDERYNELSLLILTDDLLLPKLSKVSFDQEFGNAASETVLYSKVLSISPNVSMLVVNHSSSALTIDLLSKLPKRTKLMIKKLECSNCYKECIEEFHSTFLQELSQILPKLQNIGLYKIPTTHGAFRKMLTPVLAIDHARKYFRNLIHLRIQLNIRCYNDKYGRDTSAEVQEIRKELESYLKDDQSKNVFYEDTCHNDFFGQRYILDVWL